MKTTRQILLQKWSDKFAITPTKNSVFGINFEKKVNFQTLDEFHQGFFEIQDEASQLVANLVEAIPGDQVLDYCAGSGGKTLAFAQKLQMKGQIHLHDIRPNILIQAKKRLKRAGIENAQILPYDSPAKKNLKGKMDWVINLTLMEPGKGMIICLKKQMKIRATQKMGLFPKKWVKIPKKWVLFVGTVINTFQLKST